jgi:uncharacterized damage-inducible protein DinB
MRLSETLLPELDQEMATTRRLLERVPDDSLGWRPHDKSMTLGRLGTHVAELPGFVAMILGGSEFDLTSRTSGYTPKTLDKHQEMLDLFDGNVRSARTAIESAENEALMQPWTLRRGEQVIFTLPRIAALRSMFFSHTIHHRGQLSVYLRLNDVPVPSIYGPSADEAV